MAQSDGSTGKAGGRKRKRRMVFVTVGTTKFEELISTLDSTQMAETLAQLGFDHLRIQIGKGERRPTQSLEGLLSEEDETGHLNIVSNKEEAFTKDIKSPCGDITVDYYRYRHNYREDIEDAELVISHAGAGSIMETLELQRPLIVVINTSLMNNHQDELASELAKERYLVSTTCKDLHASLRSKEWMRLRSRGELNVSAFPRLVDELMGLHS